MFTFKGISSREMGVVLEDEIFETSPSSNYEEIEIDGKDGSIFTELNYKNIVVTKNATLLNKSKAGDVKAWLHGAGIFELAGKCKRAIIYDGLEFERHGPFKYSFPITFIMDPFWYVDLPYQEVTDGKIINTGNVTAKPILKLLGTGKVDITVNDVRFVVNFDDTGEIEIDCDKKEETKPKCIEIEFDYPTLKPGANKVTVNAGKCQLYVKRKDRWI